MRKLLSTVILTFTIFTVSAQNNDYKNIFSFSAETGYKSVLNKDRSEALTITGDFGFHFKNRWAIHLPISANVTLNKNKSYDTELLIGLAPECAFGHGELGYWSFSPKIQASCLGNTGYMLYDIGIKYCTSMSPYVGLGVQFADPYKHKLQHSYWLYICFGVRLRK